VALLEESALDTGLAPKDVRRQIECGLSAVPSASPATGDSAPVTATPPSSAGIGTADPAPVAAADSAPATPPAADTVAAALARLWNWAPAATPAPATPPGPAPATRAQADGSAPGPQAANRSHDGTGYRRHQEVEKAKGPLLAVGAEPPPLRSPAPARERAPIPPAGARLICFNARMRPCSAAECYQWTWDGGAQWFKAAEFAPPGTGEGRTP
jgi:hypothetical protein